jgi:hypothetical protein
MNKRYAPFILAGILLFACGLYLFFSRGGDPLPDSRNKAGTLSSGRQEAFPPFEDDPSVAGEDRGSAEEASARPLPHPKDIQEIRKQIYDLNIEYVEDIPKLDRVVQTGSAPTRDFWTGDWTSADDFKEEPNGFNLEPQGDGTFVFYPDENTAKTYTFFETPKTYAYDPAKKEFSWELDYYGKTISHRARFINDSVLAMMLVSGRKVTMEIYQRQPKPPERE